MPDAKPAHPIIANGRIERNIQRIVRAAWLGALLGLAIELLLLTIQIQQDRLPDVVTLIADTLQKMTWSSLICAALSAGLAASRARLTMAGAAGLCGAPAAFLVASVLHKTLQELLGGDISPLSVALYPALIKGVQYAVLGVAAAKLRGKGAALKHYVATGAVIGVVFHGLSRHWTQAPIEPLQQAVVDITHPIGCALVAYLTSKIGLRTPHAA